MVKNSIVLSAALVASFSNMFGGFLDKVTPTSDNAKVAATFLVVSAARTAISYRVLPVGLDLKGSGIGNEVKRGVSVGSYGVAVTTPKEDKKVDQVLNTSVNVSGLTVGNVVKDAALTAAVLATLKYVAPVVTDSVSKLVAKRS